MSLHRDPEAAVELENVIGLGVAGNFAGHLEQAGEASDFVDVAVEDIAAPKGLFPFYVPGLRGHRLGEFPVSSDELRLAGEGETLQIEPEIAPDEEARAKKPGRSEAAKKQLGCELEDPKLAVEETLATRWSCPYFGRRSSHGVWPLRELLGAVAKECHRQRAAGELGDIRCAFSEGNGQWVQNGSVCAQ